MTLVCNRKKLNEIINTYLLNLGSYRLTEQKDRSRIK